MFKGRLAPSAAALGVLAILVAAPLALGHQLLSDVLASFHWSLSYLPELSPWLLLLAGIVFLIPVAVSAGLNPESRFYPRDRRAYFAWGIVLYILGGTLVVQAFEVWSYAH